MKIQTCALLALLSLAPSVYAATGKILPVANLSTTGVGGATILQISGLPELPHASFQSTNLAQAIPLSFAASKDPNQHPHDNFFGDYVVSLIPNNGLFYDDLAFGHFLIAQAFPGDNGSSGTTVPIAVYVGIDSNGDGRPQQSELLCKADYDAESASAACLADISSLVKNVPGANFWMAVQLPTGYTGYVAKNNYAILDTIPPGVLANGSATQGFSKQALVTGPGHVAANASFPIRLSPSSQANLFPAAQTYYGAVLIDADSGSQAEAAIQPFSLIRKPGNNDNVNTVEVPILPGSSDQVPFNSIPLSAAVPIAAGETLQHWFFDLPPITDASHYGTLSISIQRDYNAAQPIEDVEYALVRADFPAASVSPLIASAPATDSAIYKGIVGTPNGPDDSPVILSNLTPGRWYIVVTNKSANEHFVSVGLMNGYFQDLGFGLGPYRPAPSGPRLGAGANPTIAPGAYYNTQRSGHGIFVNQASGQQVVDWFTYLEDGTPTFYVAQAAAPDPSSGWWSAPAYRVSWDGNKGSLTPVGSITLTPIATNRPIFTWTIEGQSGSEVFDLLASPGSCPQLNGAVTNLNGAWYAPNQAGYGMDVMALPDQQFDAFYFYDNLGLARWGVGTSVPFAASSTLNLTQSEGFCPACEYAPISTQPLGTLSVDYANASNGHYSTSITLQSPLSGTWNINQPIARLTGSPVCTQ